MEQHHHAHLLLQYLPMAGPATRNRLLEAFGSASAVLEQAPDTLSPWLKPEACAALAEYRHAPTRSDLAYRLQQDVDWLSRNPEVRVLSVEDEEYPPLLRTIHRAPSLLYVRGSVEALSLPQIAMVGSRNPSVSGRDNARQFAAFLAARGFAITSGLATGVDGFAHGGALEVEGVTVAVVGTGIDRVYPAKHRKLSDDILAKGGAIVSEFPLATRPQPANFPQRNRIISGLSGGTLVVEAALKSGSLITARYALQQNREVFAIPGSIHNPLARGCHRLIREGATLVETARDIVEQLGGYLSYQTELLPAGDAAPAMDLTDDERRLFEVLGHDPLDLDTLAQHSAMDMGELLAHLMSLQLKGAVEETAAGFERSTTAK